MLAYANMGGAAMPVLPVAVVIIIISYRYRSVTGITSVAGAVIIVMMYRYRLMIGIALWLRSIIISYMGR